MTASIESLINLAKKWSPIVRGKFAKYGILYLYWVGHTPNYIKVAKAAAKQENLRNRIVMCRLGDFLEEDIMLGQNV